MDSRCSVALNPNLDRLSSSLVSPPSLLESMDTSDTVGISNLENFVESWGAVMNFVNSYEMFKNLSTVASFNDDFISALISAQLADATMSTAQSQFAAMAMHAATLQLPLSPNSYPLNIFSFMGGDQASSVNDIARIMSTITNSQILSNVSPFENPSSIQAPTPNNITPPDGSPNLPDSIERTSNLSMPMSLELPQSPESPASPPEAPVVKRRRRRNKDDQLLANGEPPVHRIRRRRTRNGSIPEEDDIPMPRTPKSVAPPGCRKQSVVSSRTMSPESPQDEEMSHLGTIIRTGISIMMSSMKKSEKNKSERLVVVAAIVVLVFLHFSPPPEACPRANSVDWTFLRSPQSEGHHEKQGGWTMSEPKQWSFVFTVSQAPGSSFFVASLRSCGSKTTTNTRA
uniref:BZIP domain-containing protein n=1 Tax=Panagrellus redivivus TaxID=6233 RepID=A0A7E4V2B8_PANRE